MRTLEVVLLAANVPTLLRPLFPNLRRTRWMDYAPAVALLLIPLQIVVEGYRWQMLPVYIFTALIFVLTLRRLMRPDATTSLRRGWAIAFGVVGLLVLALTALPGILFPVPRLPELTGLYQVGTTTYHMVDATREEIYTDAAGDSREIMVQLWYPAEPDEGSMPAPYLPETKIAGPALAAVLDLPPFILGHLDLVRTRSYPDAPMAEGSAEYPVLVFSHGLQGYRTQNTMQMEELASHGYVVVAIDHTYACAVTVFPDGRVALASPGVLSDEYRDDRYDSPSNRLVSVWAEDIRFVLDQLELFESGETASPFEGRLDLERVGVFGHSTGGGATVEVCSLDSRCRAGLGMDAWVEPVSDGVLADGLSQPFLFMNSEVWSDDENRARLGQIYDGLEGDGYLLTILGTSHYDFADLPMLSPIASVMGLKGPLNGRRVIRIVNDYTLAFFDRYLRGEGGELLDGPSADYPEVEFEAR